MSGDNLPVRPDVTFDFNLPNGIDIPDDEEIETPPRVLERATSPLDAWPSGQFRYNNINVTADTIEPNARQQTIADDESPNHRQFSLGFSDDDGSDEALERSWAKHQARKYSTKTTKGKKSPRRSDTESEGSESLSRAKKPRQSLFGDAGQGTDLRERANADRVFQIPNFNIGNRMSSLNLDQQEDKPDSMERAANTDFGLACSDIESVCSSPEPSDDGFLIPPDKMPYYELRQNIDRNKAVTHVDTDKSGNFDPDQEARDRAASLVRARAAKKERKKNSARKKGKAKFEANPDYTLKCIVKLPFESFGNVRNLTDEQQNWPSGWSDIDSAQELELKEYRGHYRARSPNYRWQPPLEDPAGKTDDLSGHPAARGCKQCRKVEQDCSLIHGGEYPCKECAEDGSECQLIQEPTEKGRCKQCDQDGVEICSFEDVPSQQMCDHCTSDGHDCNALPPHGYKVHRLAVDEIVWGPNRPSVACTTCRKLNKRCSLKSKEAKPPCRWCKKSGDPCRFFDLPKAKDGKQSSNDEPSPQRVSPDKVSSCSVFFTEVDLNNMNRHNAVSMDREPTPEIELEDGEGNRGMLTKITTSFAHPIQFGAPRSDLMDCNFCEIPIFGMFGHFEKEVHVIRWHSGLGFAEVGGGHAQNEGATKMCADCTNHRLQIMVCPGHEFQRISDAMIDHDVLAEELVSAEPGGAGMQYQLSRWCSLCFSPAIFGCSTVQPDLCGEEETDIAGCHLRLCVACELTLRSRFGDNLDALAADLDAQPKVVEADEALGRRIEGRPRADVGLLMQDGLLMRVVQANV